MRRARGGLRGRRPGLRPGSLTRTVAPANDLSGLDAARVGDRVVVVGGADYDQTEVKALVLDFDSRRWSRAAPSRLPWRAGHSVVAADRAVIVWGGSRGSAAAYDPARDGWRRIPPGPLAGRSRHAAVWTGDELLVWGGWGEGRARADGAAYDPRSRRWRRIARSPLRPRTDHAAVWTGTEMVVWGGSRRASDAWRRLAAVRFLSAPTRLLGQGVEVELDAVWTGARMVVWNGLAGAAYAPRENRCASEFTADAAAYHPARARWTMLPPAPIAGRDRHAAVWTGDAMLVFGGCCRGGRHHRDGALYSPR